MKNLELTNLGVQEMSRTEMKIIDGGGLLGDFISGIWERTEQPCLVDKGKELPSQGHCTAIRKF